jgi:hypothetical protein
MTVPAHNLYDFIHQVTEKRFWLLYFYQWGNKDLKNVLDYQKDYEHTKGPNGIDNLLGETFLDPDQIGLSRFSLARNFQPVLFCHDQEPLNYELYQDGQPLLHKTEEFNRQDYNFPVQDQNLRNTIVWSWQKQWILLHSEINSPQLQKYESTGRYCGAYWWSHALIARDWYRFAQHDQSLERKKIKKIFLIYCRDQTGTRQYRQQVMDHLKHNGQCDFANPTTADAMASAYYNSEDFCKTGISLILETLFEDPRIHLTEKTLRPIACGHPFILAAGPGALAVLKYYGFETFSPWIDESYDHESDHSTRLDLILKEVDRLSSMAPEQLNEILAHCWAVAQRNKQRFFSDNFLKFIKDELYHNVMQAYGRTQNKLDPSYWWYVRQWRKQHLPQSPRSNKYTLHLVRHLRLNQGSLEQYQRHDHSLDDESGTNCDNV